MEKKVLLLSILSVLTVNTTTKAVFFDDGRTHIINDTSYQYEGIYLDRYKNSNPGTHLDLNAGGIAGSISLFNLSAELLDLLHPGGWVGGRIERDRFAQ